MIGNIRLQNFRSYQDDSFEFSPNVTIIVGPNASGKTNLLEAILCLCRGSSYRVRDAELVNFGAPWARIDGTTNDGNRTLKLEKKPGLNGVAIAEKTFVIDGKVYKRIGLDKTLPTVLFEPNHLLLLSGSPEKRRDFMDDLLEQTISGYGQLRRRYRRTLAQRNALLKRGQPSAKEQLFAWNIRLSELGGKVVQARRGLLEQINQTASEIYSQLSDTPSVITLDYASNCDTDQYETSLLHRLEASVEQDLARGFTTFGPHRDDASVSLNGHMVAETASRGETRTLILMLKVCELEQLEKARDQTPVLLLDDVFSELDGKRRQALTSYLKKYQTFITTTDADIVVQHFMDSCKIIPLTPNN